jgi:hypothetical protein
LATSPRGAAPVSVELLLCFASPKPVSSSSLTLCLQCGH